MSRTAALIVCALALPAWGQTSQPEFFGDWNKVAPVQNPAQRPVQVPATQPAGGAPATQPEQNVWRDEAMSLRAERARLIALCRLHGIDPNARPADPNRPDYASLADALKAFPEPFWLAGQDQAMRDAWLRLNMTNKLIAIDGAVRLERSLPILPVPSRQAQITAVLVPTDGAPAPRPGTFSGVGRISKVHVSHHSAYAGKPEYVSIRLSLLVIPPK